MGTVHLTHFITGIVLILISLPLIKGKIKRNHWYGIRLPSTMRNERIWYASNKYGAELLSKLGMLIMILSTTFYYTELGKSVLSLIFMTIFLLTGVIVVAVKASRYASRLWDEENEKE